jgi:hypothetical protein
MVGILANMDIAANIANVLTFAIDQSQLGVELIHTRNEMSKVLSSAQELSKLALLDGYSILKQALNNLPQEQSILLQMQINALGLSANGAKMTANMMSTAAKYYAQNNWCDLEASLIYEMPETYIRAKVSRWYNDAYRIGVLNSGFATTLYLKNKINKTEWRKALAEEGLPDKIQDYMLDEADNKLEITQLVRMGQYIDFSDVFIDRMLTESKVTENEIRLYWKKYIHAARLRDEMLEYKQYLKAAFQDGLINETQLEVELAGFKASQEEIDQIVETQQSQFNRTLIGIEQDAQLWLYRKGVFDSVLELDSETTNDGGTDGKTLIDTNLDQADHYFDGMIIWLDNGEQRVITSWILSTHTLTVDLAFGAQVLTGVTYSIYSALAEETLYANLVNLGINSALVNGLVRLEAAKQSLNWERQ